MGARLRYNNPGQGNLKNAWVASNEPAGKKVLAPRPLGVGSSGWVLLCWTRLVSRHTATSPLRGEGPTVTVGGGGRAIALPAFAPSRWQLKFNGAQGASGRGQNNTPDATLNKCPLGKDGIH